MADPDLTALDDGDLNWGSPLRAVLLDTSRRADGRLPANVRTGTAYTAVLADIATTVYRNLTGTTSIVAGSGMTLVSVGRTAPFAMAGQGAIVEVVFESSTLAYVDGAIT
jgi:hypothetical protein